MKKFLEKYIDYLEPKDAMKMISKRLHKAKELCEEHDEDYMRELATAYDMIEDYFDYKAVSLDGHKRA